MKSSGAFQPFRNLKHLLQRHATSVETLPAVRVDVDEDAGDSAEREQRLFERAMADVTPLTSTTAPPAAPAPPRNISHRTDDEYTLDALRELVATGRGYRVADTPEYIEGTGHRVPAGLARLLHRGTFSIQSHIDLHGMTVPIAREAVDRFLDDAVRRGFSAVLIVHGRGLSSPAQPVLKTKVAQWLTSGPWRKWVLAYASARPCDGGAGATYVLLRARPSVNRRR